MHPGPRPFSLLNAHSLSVLRIRFDTTAVHLSASCLSTIPVLAGVNGRQVCNSQPIKMDARRTWMYGRSNAKNDVFREKACSSIFASVERGD